MLFCSFDEHCRGTMHFFFITANHHQPNLSGLVCGQRQKELGRCTYHLTLSLNPWHSYTSGIGGVFQTPNWNEQAARPAVNITIGKHNSRGKTREEMEGARQSRQWCRGGGLSRTDVGMLSPHTQVSEEEEEEEPQVPGGRQLPGQVDGNLGNGSHFSSTPSFPRLPEATTSALLAPGHQSRAGVRPPEWVQSLPLPDRALAPTPSELLPGREITVKALDKCVLSHVLRAAVGPALIDLLPVKVRGSEYGAAFDIQRGRGNGRSPRKPADQRHRPLGGNSLTTTPPWHRIVRDSHERLTAQSITLVFTERSCAVVNRWINFREDGAGVRIRSDHSQFSFHWSPEITPVSLDQRMNKVMRSMTTLIVHKAEEYTTCIQVPNLILVFKQRVHYVRSVSSVLDGKVAIHVNNGTPLTESVLFSSALIRLLPFSRACSNYSLIMNPIKEGLLIEAVRRHALLYDQSDIKYHDLTATRNAWDAVGERSSIETDVGDVDLALDEDNSLGTSSASSNPPFCKTSSDTRIPSSASTSSHGKRQLPPMAKVLENYLLTKKAKIQNIATRTENELRNLECDATTWPLPNIVTLKPQDDVPPIPTAPNQTTEPENLYTIHCTLLHDMRMQRQKFLLPQNNLTLCSKFYSDRSTRLLFSDSNSKLTEDGGEAAGPQKHPSHPSVAHWSVICLFFRPSTDSQQSVIRRSFCPAKFQRDNLTLRCFFRRSKALHEENCRHGTQFALWYLEQYNSIPGLALHILYTNEGIFTRDEMYNIHNMNVWSDSNTHATHTSGYQLSPYHNSCPVKPTWHLCKKNHLNYWNMSRFTFTDVCGYNADTLRYYCARVLDRKIC
ncbi:hypothetical protein PR048_015544 [Dryococelus australis]|uniref:MADF domain-containing protein n=1 Tax=Dryococelus australis TaxID=614101 RepID=A0ABQ9HHI8_9NEOP|nr:hypothetical protein PR048_015544 [Dryococelus australis]